MNLLKVEKDNDKGSAIVIGGSLSGLMTALALAEEGVDVVVLEKAKEGVRTGAGLQVNGYSLGQSKIEKRLKQIVSNGKSTVMLWSDIESRIRSQAHKLSNITLKFETRVIEIGQDENHTFAKTDDDEIFKADVLIGADGHRSMVREKIAPDHPHARYAGYVVWMASVAETELDENSRPPIYEKVEMLGAIDGFLFGSLIKDEKHIRRFGATWYDNTQTDLLNRLGAVKGDFVHHSVDGLDISDKDLEVLIANAKRRWPSSWISAVVYALRSRNFIGIPVKEYVPEKLVDGRFAIIGDAAHVPAPITASGFNESLIDAAVLAECASKGLKNSKAYDILEEYEVLRLKKVQRMVESGNSFSRSFGRY